MMMTRSSDKPMTRWDALKLVALALMFVDHAGAFYFEQELWLRGIGRACAPIFLFLAGFAPHYRFRPRLLLLAVALTTIDWWVKGTPNTLNILWSILFMRALFGWLEQHGRVKLQLHEWLIASVPFLALLPVAQYTPFWLLFGLCGYVHKHRAAYAAQTPARCLVAVVIFYAIIYAWFSEFTLAATLAMTLSLLFMMGLMHWFVRAPTAAVTGPAIAGYVSRYSAEIYVAHLVLLILLTGQSI